MRMIDHVHAANLDFYNIGLSLDCYGNDDFQALEADTVNSEEARITHYRELEEDSTKLRIETAFGLMMK